jgi:hypothetical protein
MQFTNMKKALVTQMEVIGAFSFDHGESQMCSAEGIWMICPTVAQQLYRFATVNKIRSSENSKRKPINRKNSEKS